MRDAIDDSLLATYVLVAPNAPAAAACARDVAIEQTVEVTEALCVDPFIQDRIVGRVEGVDGLGGGRFQARIRYSFDVLTAELPQIWSVLYGNVSLKPGVRLVGVDPGPGLAARIRGPRHGVAGIRALLGVPDRPLVMGALKPLGRTVDELASYARDLAAGGLDILKDDHGLADQPLCRFETRVERCAAAVAEGRAVSGHRTLYFPCVTGPADRVVARARFARDAGAGGVLIAPFVAGIDFMRAVADDTGLPIMSHPALAGAFLASPDHGIAHDVLFGTMMRLSGADLVVFPSWGGRFPFTRDQCVSIDRALKRDLHAVRPALPVPAGGISLDRVPAMLAPHGRDVVFLIGSALYERSPDLAANAAFFRSMAASPDGVPR